MDFVFNALTWVALTTWVFYFSVIATFFLAYIFVRDDGNRSDGFPFFPSLFIAGVIYLTTLRYDSTGVLFSWPNILYTIGGYLLIGFFVSLFKWIRKLAYFKKYASDLKASIDLSNFTCTKEKDADSFKRQLNSEYGASAIGEIDGKFYLKPVVSSLTRHWVYWPFFLISVLVDPIYDLVNLTVTLLKGFYLNLAKRFAV